MAYCLTTDLLTGSIPTPASVVPQKYVDDAADEMDSYIGRVYTTPVTLNQSDPVQRPSYLMLKRINSHLATGRLILAVAAGGEDTNLHAYGASLVKESLEALQAIGSGEYIVEGGLPLPGGTAQSSNSPLIDNLDATSQVEDFYDMIQNPPLVRPYVSDPWHYGW